LVNVAFSAECAKFGGGPLYIRVFHRANGIPQPPVEPYDGFQSFCQPSSYTTHKGNWVRRVGAGTHVLQVQFWNPGPAGSVGSIDDWTFELVVYD
jgi:hypothetical protein